LIKSLEEFAEFLKICRKQGVTEVSCHGVSVNFGDHPKKKKDDAEEQGVIPTDEPTMEELMFYSATGLPVNENNQG
jgi:hypothetical protein